MKTNIKMKVTPEQSRKVQEICFKNNITWNGLKAFDHIKEPFIYIYDSRLSYDCGKDNRFFNNHSNEEIDADLFIRTNGTCEEKMEDNRYRLETFVKENNFNNIEDLKTIVVLTANKHDILEQKLKKKNKILKKARIKRKNQREELNKLNIKLQKSISLEEHHLKMKTVLNEKHKLEVENKEMGRLVNLNASVLVLVGQTKELARQKIEEQSKEIENLKAVIEYLESKLK